MGITEMEDIIMEILMTMTGAVELTLGLMQGGVEVVAMTTLDMDMETILTMEIVEVDLIAEAAAMVVIMTMEVTIMEIMAIIMVIVATTMEIVAITMEIMAIIMAIVATTMDLKEKDPQQLTKIMDGLVAKNIIPCSRFKKKTSLITIMSSSNTI